MALTELPDGRRLAWSDWGDPAGRVVLMCPGAGMAGALPFGAEDATRLGLRLVSVDRPGLGGSDPDAGRDFATWTRDIRALLDRIADKPALALGFSQGAPFALALAAAGVVAAVSVVSGQDELAHPAILPRLPEPVAGMVRRAAAAPATLEAEIAATATPDWLWSMIEMMSGDADRAVYAAEDFAPLYRAALAAGFRQGAAGYARDTVLAMAPWPFRVETLACPAQLWFGRLDTSPVHSPDGGETLAARIPGATLTQVEGEGSAILWTRAVPILAALRALI